MDIKLYKTLTDKYKSKDLKVFFNEVATESLIDYILTRKDSFYRNFKVKKKSGGYRNVNEPLNQLFSIQKEFSLFFLINRKNNDHSHGFELNKSIISNANKHVNKKIVLNIDLENFFSNISSSRIIDLLIENFNVSEIEAIKIADLLTYKDSLPQGSPSSPIISNFICEKLDFELYKYCKRFNITYTRYADDMSFSFSFNKLPKLHVQNIISIIEQNQFKINKKKYRYYHRNTRQIVTGLVVNDKVNVKREFYKNLRAVLNNWKLKGFLETQLKFNERYGEDKNFQLTVKGWINFFGQVKGNKNPKFLFFQEQYKKLSEELETIKKFNFNNPISIEELKSILGIEVFKLNTIKDNNGLPTNFFRHWDEKRRIDVILNKNLAIKIKENPEFLLSIDESVKKGVKGEYLRILINEFNMIL